MPQTGHRVSQGAATLGIGSVPLSARKRRGSAGCFSTKDEVHVRGKTLASWRAKTLALALVSGVVLTAAAVGYSSGTAPAKQHFDGTIKFGAAMSVTGPL